jgi:phosphoketolase
VFAGKDLLVSVTGHCLRSRHYVHVIVAGKQPELQWLDMDFAIKHRTAGLGIWEWASNDEGRDPDVVMGLRGGCADAGDASCCRDAAPALSGTEDSRHQRDGLDDAAAAE